MKNSCTQEEYTLLELLIDTSPWIGCWSLVHTDYSFPPPSPPLTITGCTSLSSSPLINQVSLTILGYPSPLPFLLHWSSFSESLLDLIFPSEWKQEL